MRPLSLLAFALLAPILAFFNPKLSDQPFLCGPSPDRCPPGYSCLLDGVCHLDGAVDAPPPDAMPCNTPGTATCTTDSMLVGCGADSTVFMKPCPAGCDPANLPVPDCFQFQPSNLPSNACDRGNSTDLEISASMPPINTDTGCPVPLSPPVGTGPDMCLFK